MTHMKKPGSTGLKKTKVTHQQSLFFSFLLIMVAVFMTFHENVMAENGYELWLRYAPVSSPVMLKQYRSNFREIVFQGNSRTIQIARQEMSDAIGSMLGIDIPSSGSATVDGFVAGGTPENSEIINDLNLGRKLMDAGEEGFIIIDTMYNNKKCIAIAANNDIGVLYGVFHLMRMIQTEKEITGLNVICHPKIKIRILNHWDNLNRTVERGYAGFSIWDWHKLPDYIDQRYIDYARANASVGINGTVVNNVNSNALILTDAYLVKLKALADVFRTYGIKVYLSARFSAPIEIGGLSTADPLNADVINWWKKKAGEIYTYIPDFGGFLVKANSEGQPGPQDYGRKHSDGINMLAGVLKPYGGVVMWRAFVYDDKVPDDRAKQAYNEFTPFDGKLAKNALIQVKNGPVDFQPREPFHPLFGSMLNTPLMMEFQITQEYLGFATHLVYLGTLYEECLQSDTYCKGKGSAVSKVIQGLYGNSGLSGMAGVANIGTDINWCGHPFAQANWFAFGRLAWNPDLKAEDIADDWIRMTFTNDNAFVEQVKHMMMASREITVNYMTPLGLHHMMDRGHHYGPGPWIDKAGRMDWTSVYYHKADSNGIGFDRTKSGSNALEQYFSPIPEIYGNPETCPDKYLLWFHHLSWDYITKSGRTLWEELCYRYYSGVDSVRQMRKTWEGMEGKIDEQRFRQVQMLLAIQEKEAVIWRDACLLYFQRFSKRAIPDAYEKPEHTLDYYMNLKKYNVPGI
jgi:alpha-glucuronidase